MNTSWFSIVTETVTLRSPTSEAWKQRCGGKAVHLRTHFFTIQKYAFTYNKADKKSLQKI